MIDIGPRRRKHRRAGGAPREDGVRSRRRSGGAAPAGARRSEQRLVEPDRHERRNLVERRADAGVAEIDVVVDAGDERHVQVHPLHGPGPRVVDRMRVAGPAQHTRRALHARRAPVDRELRFAVEDHEHLLDDVVEVMADAGARRNDAAMQEVELRRQRAAIQQRRERHGAGPAVDGGQRAKRRRIRVHNPLRQAAGRGRALGAAAHQRNGDGDDQQKRMSHGSTSVHPGRKTESVDLRLDRPDR